jgi:hypothetical protein
MVGDRSGTGEEALVGVSAVGASSFSMRKVRTGLAAFVAVGGAAFYLYGPAVTPALNAAASGECNDLVGGNYRSYQLQWVVGTRPHWLCSDRYRPGDPTIDMGWWVTPGF